MYFSWSRPQETSAPLAVLEDRFPALFEARRMRWPKYEALSNPEEFDQGIAGFLDHIQLPNFAECRQELSQAMGSPVAAFERHDGISFTALDERFLKDVDTLIVVSFDSKRTHQEASNAELAAVRGFLDQRDRLLFVCPHHDIGSTPDPGTPESLSSEEIEFRHHGDSTIPARQQFGGFGISLLRGLGIPVENRFGLRPAMLKSGEPAPIRISESTDRLGLLQGVTALNLHLHLPHFERVAEGVEKMDVLAQQLIDVTAPPHPFTKEGRETFDALLQSRADVFSGTVLVCDTTLWSSTAGGTDNLRKFWRNVALQERVRGAANPADPKGS